MKITHSALAAILAIVIAALLALSTYRYSRAFHVTQLRTRSSSNAHDTKLVATVRNLEELLAHRASFGYTGNKDPMTGRLRRVVKPVIRKKTAAAPRTAAERPDSVRLTAIIYDDIHGRYSAVVMDGERTYSVVVGDNVGGRRVIGITSTTLTMETRREYFRYDIYGKRTRRKK